MTTVKKTYSHDDRELLRKSLFEIGDENVSKNIFYSIKSRYKILYIVSAEEERIIKFFRTFCISEVYTGFTWDCSRGLIDLHSEKPETTSTQDMLEPEAILSYLIDTVKKGKHESSNGRIFLLLDFHKFLDDADAALERKLKEFAYYSETDSIVIVAPEYICGSTLDKEVTMIDFPYPSKKEIEEALDNIKQRILPTKPKIAEIADEKREEIVHAVSGLTIKEAKNAFAKTVVQDRTFKITTLLKEKESIVRKSGLLEICDSKFSMDDIGGLENLKEWLSIRKDTFSDEAKEFGLIDVRGVLLAGISGCGKSLSAKSVASLFEMPLLRLDMGAMFSSRVGDSEKRIRDALKCVESIAPCVMGNTKILLEDNSEKIIEEMYNSYENYDYYYQNHYKVWSLNKDTFKKEIDKVIAITKRTVDKIITIKTDMGEIKTSEDHKMLVLKNNKIFEIPAKEFKEREHLLSFASILDNDNILSEELVEVEILEIKTEEKETIVYDLCCEKNHNFIANNLLSKNCCLWADEIEKGISGTASSAHTDGGTTARVVSTLLTWMQEKQKMVFIIATANSVADIPPEFMRAGRFDEVFFLDLPNVYERADIAGKLLRRKKRDPDKFDLDLIGQSCDNYVGAEIEKAIDNSLFQCYHEGKRELITEDICYAFKQFVPLYTSRKKEIDEMRNWAKEGGAVIANSSTKPVDKKTLYHKDVSLDMDEDEDIEV